MGKATEDLSIIGRRIRINGEITASGRIIVQGRVEGTLTGGEVVISHGGRIDGRAAVDTMAVGGEFDGELTVSGELVVMAGGRCSGHVVCKDLVVEPGGILNADIRYQP